jgi:hypothetical protein
MGFGIKIEVPKVEVPKVEIPSVDPSKIADDIKNSATGAVNNIAQSVKNTAESAVKSVQDKIAEIKKSLPSLDAVAGAITDVSVSFTGDIDDIVLEPHFNLSANASYEDTRFEEGLIEILVDMTAAEASKCNDEMRLYSSTGSFDQKKKVSEFFVKNEEYVMMMFENAPMNETFSLEVSSGDNAPKLIFSNVQYGDLKTTRKKI